MAMEWTDELIARLRELWEQGLSTAEIGRQLSITKNAVVGKAHRLNLPSRPSPIRNKAAAEGGAKATPRPRASRAKKPAEGDVTEAKEKGKKVAPGPATVEASKVEKPKKLVKAQEELPSAPAKKTAKSAQEVAEAPQAVSAPPRRVREAMDRSIRQGPTCQWPHGDPGTPEFHFCGATPLAGKPYCAEHAAIAYVKIRDRRH